MHRSVSVTDAEPGIHPLSSALAQEGFGDGGAVQVTESFSRHLMVVTDLWQSDGFEAVAREYLGRTARERQVSRRIDDNGEILLHRVDTGHTERSKLVKGLAPPSWFYLQTGEPWQRSSIRT